jgi:hypothetical protein
MHSKSGSKGQAKRHRGRLPLVLQMILLRRHPSSRAPAEQGYSLAVALIAAFVLLLGVGALASRSNLGFIGQVFQIQNRQARDVAESAIRQFADTLNREPNRHLLIAGTTANWGNNNFRNICTAVNDTPTVESTDGTVAEVNGDANYTAPSGYQRFVPPANPASPTWQAETVDAAGNAVANGREFYIEEVAFLNQSKSAYWNSNTSSFNTYPSTGNPNQENPFAGESYWNVYRVGGERSLIRVTARSRIQNPNGGYSYARISQELEVVPKCCNRSFPKNLFTSVNWGRDSRGCPRGVPGEGDYGVIGGMNGGTITGSANVKPIRNEFGSLLETAACWSANQSDPDPSDLTDLDDPVFVDDSPNVTNPQCPAGQISVGNISFPPAALDFKYPANNPAITGRPVPVANVTTGYIYYDKTLNPASGIVYKRIESGAEVTSRINGDPFDSTSPDACYETATLDRASDPIRPYALVTCEITTLAPQGNTKIYIDTSAAFMNFIFEGDGESTTVCTNGVDYATDPTCNDGDPATPDTTTTVNSYGVGRGTAGVIRIHRLQTNFSNPPYSPLALTLDANANDATLSSNILTWPGGLVLDEPTREGTYLELCTDKSDFTNGDTSNTVILNCANGIYSLRTGLNFYTEGTGTFLISGNVSGLAYNIYAPNADVRFNGGGNVSQFMGQIWVNNLDIRGNIKINTFSGAGATGGGTYNGIPLIDFIARSFTQSSGFGGFGQ